MKRKLKLKRLDPVERFWKVFKQREREWSERLADDREAVFDELAAALHRVDDDLAFEVSEHRVSGKRELILSADGIFESFGSVITLYEAAPALHDWKIIAFRPRMESAEGFIIRIDELELSYSDIYFRCEPHGDYVDLTVYIRNFDSEDIRFSQAYFLLLDTLIGEFDAVVKIGETKFERLEAADGLQPLAELTAIVDALE